MSPSRKTSALLLILIATNFLFAKTYFQQQVNYTIKVRLNDSLNTLSASESIEYTNNSNDTLTFIYFHLWPNAYQKNTALDKQLLEDGKSFLHFANDKYKGFIDSLNFTSYSQKLHWEYDASHHDICKVFLVKPLLPNQTVEISTPFYVKLPSATISRLGYIKQFYAITQWYPKPAVYDVNGWNQMPYLNQGEFYSEFGNFDVTITLPENYVVGATGDLQTQTEIDFLNEKAGDSSNTKLSLGGVNSFPKSSSNYKTIRYTQQNVHDFAWFADKRFVVRKGEVKLPHSGNTVTTWAMFTPQNARVWKNVTQYMNDALYYYSKWNGDYPYKQCTAIDGTISAGGGMEYPNVTIINPTSDSVQMDIVITHEVGHNWFYGILGSNERQHPWMDEGINSFNELRYVRTKYPTKNLPSMVMPSKGSQNIIGLKKLPASYFYNYMYWVTALYNTDQPIELPAQDFTNSNYGQIVYQKSAASFNLLQHYLGEELFDTCMHNYFNTWKFKHPQPSDIRTIFENTTHKNLSWFFDDLIGTKGKVVIKKTHSGFDKNTKQFLLTLKNRGRISTPTEITFISKDSTYTKWIEPFEKDTTINFSPLTSKLILDKSYAGLNMLGSNIVFEQKDFITPHFKQVRKTKVYFFPHATNPSERSLFVVPVLGFNSATPLQAGVLITNKFYPQNRFVFNLMPMYAPYNKRFTGAGKINYTFTPSKFFRRISVGAYLRSFVTEEEIGYSSENNTAIGRYAEFVYNTALRSKYSGGFTFRQVDSDLSSSVSPRGQFTISELKFANIAKWNFLKIESNTTVQLLPKTIDRLKLMTELKFKYKYAKSKTIRVRFFAGKLFNTAAPSEYSDSDLGFKFSGNNDYMFDETYVDRNGTIQTYINDGGVRNRLPQHGYMINMIAANVSVDLVGSGLVSLYFDVVKSGSFNEFPMITLDAIPYYPQNNFLLASGVRFAIIPDYLEVNVPFYIQNSNGTVSFKNGIQYTSLILNLSKLNPFDAARKAYD